MENRIWKTVVAHAEALVAPRVGDDLPDAELLQRFVQQKDDASFSAIVRRHGPLVWGVCRHLAANECDAEDAYQASFLALFRHAHRIRKPNALGSWLHGVAGRVCRNSLRALARRKQYERLAAVSEKTHPIGAETWDHWHHAVHREVDRLPEMLRVAFVMCVLQGVPQAQAAERLGWKLGTLSGRIFKAKQALTQALERQGLTGAALATVTVGCATFCEPLSARVAEKTLISSLNGSGQCLSPAIQQLAHGATGGFMSQLKWLMMTTAAGVALMGAGGFYYAKVDAQSKPSTAPTSKNSPAAGAPSAPAILDPAPGGGMSGGGRILPSTSKVEYRFIPIQNKEEFKKILVKQGEEGWEYVGTTPGENELIFKQVNRGSGGVATAGVMGGGMGMPGMPGMAPGTPPNPFGAMGTGGPAGFPGGAGMAGSAGFPGGGGGGFGVAGSRGGGAGVGVPGSPGAMMGGGGGAGVGSPSPAKKREPEKITLRPGEMMRLEFASVVKSTYSSQPGLVEISLDSSDPTRVILKTGNVGFGGNAKVRLEITSGENKTPKIFIVTLTDESNPSVD